MDWEERREIELMTRPLTSPEVGHEGRETEVNDVGYTTTTQSSPQRNRTSPEHYVGDQSPGGSNVSHQKSEDDDEIIEEEIGYSADHLAAVMKPVALTMALASLVVSAVQEPDGAGAISAGLSSYLVFKDNAGSQSGGSSDSPSGAQIGQAAINALVIVGVIAVATFVMVICYKYRCLKLMVGYLIFASAMLLGYSGGFVVYTALSRYDVRFDWVTLAFLMYNFAIVGVLAVFWQKGMPRLVTQGYLVAVSVIMAWIVTKFPEWTAWALLIALALYDLCAVLTPCGPLKKLIELAQDRQDPIPGLLYEADVSRNNGDEADRARTGPRDTFVTGNRRRGIHNTASDADNVAYSSLGAVNTNQSNNMTESLDNTSVVPSNTQRSFTTPASHGIQSMQNPILNSTRRANTLQPSGGSGQFNSEAQSISPANSVSRSTASTSQVAPAENNGSMVGKDSPHNDSTHSSSTTLEVATGNEGTMYDHHALRDSGVHHPEQYDEETGDIIDKESVESYEEEEDRSIKLGLGDFVFYSVLVARAALYDFATMAASYISILMGLVATLLLLGIFKKALPALPISIFLGVFFYFMTRIVLVPYIAELSLNGVSV